MDKTDAQIVNAILGGCDTVRKVCEKLFAPENDYEVRNKSSFLRYRLSRLIDAGIVEKSKGRYAIPMESLIYGEAVLTIRRGKEDMNIPLGKVIVTEKNGDDDKDISIIFLSR